MIKRDMKIAYCTITDPRNKSSWSGTHYYMLNELSKFAEINILGPLKNKWEMPLKIANKASQLINGKKISVPHTPLIAKEYSRLLQIKLRKKKYDYIFCPAGSNIIAFLETSTPIIYLSDATFDLMIDYYPRFTDLYQFAKKWGSEIEQKAIENSSRVIYSSDWAAESAKEIYGCQKNKITVIPFGANLKSPPPRNKIMDIRSDKFSKLKLLWVGVEWERKGGQFAYDTMVELNRRGLPTELIVCGCDPPIKSPHNGLRAEGFLDKNSPTDMGKIANLYREASMFLLPTKQECAGIVFAEAAAYGLPVLTFDTGGIGNYVENGINGYRFHIKALHLNFADSIQHLFENRSLYQKMMTASRDKYDKELNWGYWRKSLQEVLYTQDDFVQITTEKIIKSSGTVRNSL